MLARACMCVCVLACPMQALRMNAASNEAAQTCGWINDAGRIDTVDTICVVCVLVEVAQHLKCQVCFLQAQQRRRWW